MPRSSRRSGPAVPTFLQDQLGSIVQSLNTVGQVWVSTSVFVNGRRIGHSILFVYCRSRNVLMLADINGLAYQRDTRLVRFGPQRLLITALRRSFPNAKYRVLSQLKPALHSDLHAAASAATSDPEGGCGQYVELVAALQLNVSPPDWLH